MPVVEEHSPIESYGTFVVPLFSVAVEHLLAGIYLGLEASLSRIFSSRASRNLAPLPAVLTGDI